MEFLNKLEATIGGWTKSLPHLPANAQKWLGQNVWWIDLVGVILSVIFGLVAIGALFTTIALLNSVYGYYAVGLSGWSIIGSVVAIVFWAVQIFLLALAVSPLKAMLKKGWVLLFITWLVRAVGIVVSAILSFSIFGFIGGIIFGAIGLAISGYFLYEIHGQFAHVTKKVPAKKAA
jgi:hypothetical protein